MTTQENNKLIAEFMGFIPISEEDFLNYNHPYKKDSKEYKKLFILYSGQCYHNSWDWLMPVVEKIETVNDYAFDVNILSDGTIIQQLCFTTGQTIDIIRCTSAEISWSKKIDHCYLACLEFIERYNKNKLS